MKLLYLLLVISCLSCKSDPVAPAYDSWVGTYTGIYYTSTFANSTTTNSRVTRDNITTEVTKTGRPNELRIADNVGHSVTVTMNGDSFTGTNDVGVAFGPVTGHFFDRNFTYETTATLTGGSRVEVVSTGAR